MPPPLAAKSSVPELPHPAGDTLIIGKAEGGRLRLKRLGFVFDGSVEIELLGGGVVQGYRGALDDEDRFDLGKYHSQHLTEVLSAVERGDHIAKDRQLLFGKKKFVGHGAPLAEQVNVQKEDKV